MIKSTLNIMAGCAILFVSAAHAGPTHKSSSDKDFARAFPDAKSIELNDFTGKIEIAVGGDAPAVILKQGKKAYPIDFIEEDGVLTIAGEERPRHFNLHKELNWRKHEQNALKYYLADYPVLKINAPKGANVTFDHVITIAMADDGLGHVAVEKGYVEATFGNVASADIGIASSGDVSLGAVKNNLKVGIGGSGDFDAISAGEAKLVIGGSGDIQIGPIKKDAILKIGGSGDIRTGDIGGALNANVSGSGSITTNKVKEGADLSIAGSGDLTLAAVNGKTSANIAGNGDIEIRGGLAKDLHISIAGNGDFQLDGASTNLVASIIGSGSVDVKKNTGSLSTSGKHGDITVNGKRIKKKDGSR